MSKITVMFSVNYQSYCARAQLPLGAVPLVGDTIYSRALGATMGYPKEAFHFTVTSRMWDYDAEGHHLHIELEVNDTNFRSEQIQQAHYREHGKPKPNGIIEFKGNDELIEQQPA